MRSAVAHFVLVARGALVALALGTSACATLQYSPLPSPPAANAPLAERDAYYEQKKPLGIAGAPNVANNLGLLAQTGFPTLILADGSRVSNPEALLPAVGDASATAIAARKVADLRLLTNAVWTGSVLLAAGGIATMLSAVAFPGNPAAALLLTVGGGGIALVGAVGVGWATELAEGAEAEKMTAFLLYERDLRRRLGLVRPDEPLEKKWLVEKKAPPALVSPPAPAAIDPSGP